MLKVLRSGWLWLIAGGGLLVYAMLPKWLLKVGLAAWNSLWEHAGLFGAVFIAVAAVVLAHSIYELAGKGSKPEQPPSPERSARLRRFTIHVAAITTIGPAMYAASLLTPTVPSSLRPLWPWVVPVAILSAVIGWEWKRRRKGGQISN